MASWQNLVRKHGPPRHMELAAMLTSEHGIGQGHANAIVTSVLARDNA
jgi:hypothetical protein